MNKEVTMYTVVCDNCGKDSNEDNEYSCFSTKEMAEDEAMEIGWLRDNDKHYCTDCYSYDDDDNLIIKSNSNE